LALVMRQNDQEETERDADDQACDAGAGPDALAAEPEREAAMIGELNRLKGIRMNDATILVREAFWRDFRNQREVGGLERVGTVPVGERLGIARQGITKAWPPMLRAHIIQMSWRWLLWQPDSDLAQWFRMSQP
jgi:transposase